MAFPESVRIQPGETRNPGGRPKGVPSILAAMRRQLRDNPELVEELAASMLKQSKENPQYARQVLDRLEGPVANKLEVTQLSPEQAAELLRMDDQAREDTEEGE